MPMPSYEVVIATARDIAASVPLPDGWPHRGRLWPTAKLTQRLRKAGWPFHAVVIALPQTEHSGPRAGQRTADAEQEASTVPGAWLRELARRLGVPLAELVRGRIADDE